MTSLPILLIMTWCCNAPAPKMANAGAGNGGISAVTLQPIKGGKWCGPAVARFDLAVDGSPYDAVANDVRVRFKSASGEEERLAYFDGKQWCAVLLTQSPDTYTATVFRNGKQVKELEGKLDASTPARGEFVRVASDQRTFESESGARYWPLGHCLGWQGGQGLPSVPDSLRRMSENGMNWARIWACTWDGKNPFWPNDKSPLEIGDLWQPALGQWDAINNEATADGVRFQWVLFHHGEVSSMVDANWNDNPWSKKNGGFLDNPEDFFTDAKAKQLSKNYLRYVVARYGHNFGILGWELFNEVENTNAARNGRWEDVEAWHKEMADFIRGIDPYKHPVMTSSDQRPGLITSVDVCEPHGYPSDVGALLLGAKVFTEKPYFFGEVGLGKSNPSEAEQRKTIRDAIWSGYLAGHSGAGQYWYWDVVQRMNLDKEFGFSASILKENLKPGPEVQPIKVEVTGDAGGDLVLRPGISWGASTQREFQLPDESGPATAGKISSFLQGTGHADMGSEFKFTVHSPVAGKLKLLLGNLSKAGAHLHILVDGKDVFAQEFPGGAGDTPVNKEVSADYPAGTHVVLVKNDGPDWITVDSYSFAGLGKPVDAVGAKDGSTFVVRVQKSSRTMPNYKFRLSGLSSGTYQARYFDLVKQTVVMKSVKVLDGWVSPDAPLDTSDAVWLVTVK